MSANPLAQPTPDEAPLWQPSAEDVSRANVTRYMGWLKQTRGIHFESYHDLWRWSVKDLEAFWSSIWEFFPVSAGRPYTRVLAESRMPGARWFTGAELNYAEHALRRRDEHQAVIFQSELRPLTTLTRGELAAEVARVATGLRSLGVKRGDRVAALMPNIPESLVAFLATASIGAVWSACSPEFGTRSVVDRFQQIKPALLIAIDGYRYGGRSFSRMKEVAEIQSQLPTVRNTVLVPYLDQGPTLDLLTGAISWEELRQQQGELTFEHVPFDHPLWVLYSSGTTGLPKPIVQGHGGILLEHFKALSLHVDLTEEDRFFWLTTTGWMMWNFLIGGLLVGSTILLYDGSAAHPDLGVLWRFAEETGCTYFGVSAPYIQACMKAGIEPGKKFNLDRIRGLGSTGAPLSPEGFRWVYEKVGSHLLLGSICGGTDVCTGFMGSSPLLPVYAGEIQCRYLGAGVEAYDQQGRPVVDQVGELVVTAPMPSMPLFFWNDPDGHQYRESYFEDFPGVWRHGDWIKLTGRESCVIYGRSDSTLNRAGVRMGTSEFYRAVDELDEILESMVVDTGQLDSEGRLLLFVVLREGLHLDDGLRLRITNKLRTVLSPRHVPDETYSIPDVPKTLSGKKLEVPVKRILNGTSVEEAMSKDAMANPESLQFFVDLAHSINT